MTTEKLQEEEEEEVPQPWEKTVRARLNPKLLLIVEEAKKEGYSEAKMVREGLTLFGKKMRRKKKMTQNRSEKHDTK